MARAGAMNFSVLLAQGLTAVKQPFVALVQFDSPLFLPFLLSTVLIAVVAFAFAGAGNEKSVRGFFRTTFSRKVWGHPSAVADYKFYVVNGILFPIIFGPMILTGGLIADAVHDGLAFVAGGTNFGGAADSWTIVVFTFAFFVAYDLGRYFGHSLQHEVPLLWRFHKIHHSAQVLTPFTNFRAHPVDLLVMAISANLLTGLVTGLFMFLFAGKLYVVTFFSLHVLIFAYNLVGNLRHTHVWISYGRLGHFLISPAQHQIHHSTEPRHFGKNRGFALALWDWIFGTLYVPAGRETFEIGLGDGTDARYAGVWPMYSLPFKERDIRPGG
jgi:sterol desaturase/sphingolipid hydroxylase (fatty acid hydroxylase superfamily)